MTPLRRLGAAILKPFQWCWRRLPDGAKVGATAAILFALYVLHVIDRDLDRARAVRVEPDCSTTDCPPPDREETPFLRAGETLESLTGLHANNWRRLYNPVRRQYPDAASCIVGGATYAGDYSDASLRWSEFPTQTEAEVCLFRLFAKLGTLERIEAWLTRLGFADPYKRDGSILVRGKRVPVTDLSMSWDMHNPAARWGGKEPYCGVFRATAQAYTVTSVVKAPDELMWVHISGVGCWQK